MHHGPLSKIMYCHTPQTRGCLALGIGPAGLRTDPAGIAIELRRRRFATNAGPVYFGILTQAVA